MKKWLAILFVVVTLTGCSNKKLVRIDFQKGENLSEENMIIEQAQLNTIETIFRHVKWEDAKVQMVRKEDMKLTFFYQYNPNEPERLEEYKVWFNKDMVIEIVDPNENRYGKLDEPDALKLTEALR